MVSSQGATTLTENCNPFGLHTITPFLVVEDDRYGGVKDPVGSIWWLVTHIGSPPTEEPVKG